MDDDKFTDFLKRYKEVSTKMIELVAELTKSSRSLTSEQIKILSDMARDDQMRMFEAVKEQLDRALRSN